MHLHKIQHQPHPGLRGDPADAETNQQFTALPSGPHVFRPGKRTRNTPAVIRTDLADRSYTCIMFREIRIGNITQGEFPAGSIFPAKSPHDVILRKSNMQATEYKHNAQQKMPVGNLHFLTVFVLHLKWMRHSASITAQYPPYI